MARIVLVLLTLLPCLCLAQPNEDLQALAKAFFAWRAVTQPATPDDILRVERPDGWIPDYSKSALAEYRQKYANFRQRLDALPQQNWSRSDSVDFLLLHSAIERVNWELNIQRHPQRNPDFYINQTIGALYELLLIHAPITDERARNIILRLQSFPATISHAKENLTEPVAAFADIALAHMDNARERLKTCAEALKPEMSDQFHSDLDSAVGKAATALEDFAAWLQQRKPDMARETSVGAESYAYFLREIALMPYTPQELLLMGQLEWSRSVAFDVYEALRNASLPAAPLFETAADQIAQSRKDEAAIRRFLDEKNIMSVPEWVQHYYNEKMPAYVTVFQNMGVPDDLTSETRLDENSVSYIVEPSPDLSFFRRASAQDPRPIIIHEGVPGHYFQLVLSWSNENPIRRRFFDSGPIEGIGFYVEELLLQFGLFDDRPHTREIIYRFMRLRALRVDVDVNLALGNYSIEQAAAYLAKTVPVDEETAVWEARFFASTPGQAISYQIGKLQILDLIADAKMKLGDNFSLRHYHDYMMANGNVPIALQRWEYLGAFDEVAKLWPSAN